MSNRTDPLQLEVAVASPALRLVRQPPPVGSATFTATAVVNAGWAFDPPGVEGTARIATQLATSGAGHLDRRALARLLDRTGATLGGRCDPESAELTVWGPADAWRRLVGLLSDAVLRPRYDPGDLARVRRQLAERQLREMTQPAGRAERELLRAIFPEGHPYRTSGTGDAATVGRIGRSSLRRFHHERWARGEVLLAMTGRAPIATMVEVAQPLFRDLELAPNPTPRLPSPISRPRRKIEVELPGRSQVEVRVGGASIARTDPRFAAAYLGNEVLGGVPALSRLFRRVRSKAGLAYHASSHLESMRFGGYWVAQAGAGADRWRKVVPMLRDEVDRIDRRTIPSTELETVRESRIGEMALSLETNQEAHELAVDAAYHQLPLDFWKQWPGQLRSVTPADVRRATSVALDLDRSVTVVCGPVGAG
jgi:zinc protease